MTEDFSPGAYRALLERFLALGYEVRGFPNAVPSKPHLILRHDIDMSLQVALEAAETEHNLGLAATYFVLLQTEMYNAVSRRGREAIRDFITLGHDVGLHFDASGFSSQESLEDAAASECRILEEVTGQPVTVISFHRPAPHLLGYAPTIAGRIHAYMPRYFSDMGYCSDSQGCWRFGHPLDHEVVAKRRALQLLTHPIWWQEPAALDPVRRLDRFTDDRLMLLKEELASNCIPYRNRADAEGKREGA